MSTHKRKDFDCNDTDISLLKKAIAAYHKEDKAFRDMPYNARISVQLDALDRIAQALRFVQAMFHNCTSSYNSLHNCELVKDVTFFEKFVDSYEKSK